MFPCHFGLGLAAACLALTACGSGDEPAEGPSAVELQARCPSLAGQTIAASAIGLPSGAASIGSATFVPAVAQAVAAGVTTPATPDYCRVLGTIAPLDDRAQAINFQINLPIDWNGRALQYGGGGFNGTLVTGLLPLRDAAPDDPLPLARGYATLGTDSGHQAASVAASEPASFALNDEMLTNFAYASYKKVRDVSVAVMQDFYRAKPRQVYYFGGSEGGREGLTMAQRFPEDYDGVVSVVPVINWTGLFHAFVRNQVPQFSDWLEPEKTALVSKAVVEACDALDGLEDGVVNNYLACQSKVDFTALRCADGSDQGSACLSDAEIALLKAIHTPYHFSFPLANGLTHYPPWLYGHENALDNTAVSLVRWVTGTAAPSIPPNASANATQWLYGSNWIRYVIARDANFDVRGYDPDRFVARVQATSALMDSTSPDLSAFFARGGKLILRENAADRAQSPLMGFEYYQSLIDRLGQAAVDQSVRLYVSPGSTHSGNARTMTDLAVVPIQVDLLDPLDAWVRAGTVPADSLVQTAKSAVAPFTVQASRPMCRYLSYPHYGGGDRLLAASYRCTPSN
ncbi:MAG: Mono(2-hydroxyethyl) terephthalate hydrolase [Paracidovorax wautersii]|uniref:Mono(2-hydroxyethyl) terephthalate hydrolase n=1 Tax=Paracidovorax wautersii TaxID=1177982 RepID=A0A7V8FSD0_9BURK|nr:MAG: Mono(2-hydroxyethyl) terephthalate hydrolase [Paracidovorax wautersii]